MNNSDKFGLIALILAQVYKYDAEGRRASLTAEEAVAYAKTLTAFIEGENNV